MMPGYSPQISVILPVYNGEKYLAEAIDSILAQTFPDFEFILINDCSSDRTAEILSSYADYRIRIVNHSSNQKLSKSLNKGIELAQGKFIARMDADDISLPDRFEKQVAFLKTHPEIGVVGCKVKIIDEQGYITGELAREIQPELIKWELFFGCPFAHPSVMMRADLVKSTGGYSNDLSVAVDYEYWTRLIKVTRFANLSEVLLLYRTHPESVSKKYRPEQDRIAIRLQELLQTDYIGVDKAKKLVELIHLKKRSPAQAVQAAGLVYDLYQKYNQIERLSLSGQILVRRRVGKQLQRLVSPFHHSNKALIWLFRAYFLSPDLIRDFFRYPHNF